MLRGGQEPQKWCCYEPVEDGLKLRQWAAGDLCLGMCKEWIGRREIDMFQVEDLFQDNIQMMQDLFEGKSKKQRKHLRLKVTNI